MATQRELRQRTRAAIVQRQVQARREEEARREYERRTSPEYIKQEQERYIRQAKAEQAEKSLAAVNAQISQIQGTIEELRTKKALAQQRNNIERVDDLAREITRFQDMRDELSRVKTYAKTGEYKSEDLIEYATARGGYPRKDPPVTMTVTTVPAPQIISEEPFVGDTPVGHVKQVAYGEPGTITKIEYKAPKIPWTYEKAPTFEERRAAIMRPEGEPLYASLIAAPVRLLRFTGKELAREYDILEQKRMRADPYYENPLFKGEARVIEAIPQYLPYAAPTTMTVAAFSTAGELTLTPSGRKSLEQFRQSAEVYARKIGVPPIKAKVLSYAAPAAAVGASLALGAYGVYRGVKWLKTPIVTRTPLRPRKEGAAYVETSRPIIDFKGKVRELKSYIMTGEKAPPYVYEKTVRFRKIFHMKPLVKRTYQAKTWRIISDVTVDEVPFMTLGVGRGSKAARFDVLSGETTFINLKKISKLSKIQQRNLRILAEDIAGRPVAMKRVPKMFRKDAQVFRNYIESEKMFTLRPTKAGADVVLLAKGKTITRSEMITQVRPIRETEAYTLFRGDSIYADVTKPFARATGQTQKLKGFIVRYKEPVTFGPETEKLYIKLFPKAKLPPAPITETQAIEITKTLRKTYGTQTVIPKPPLIQPPSPKPIVTKAIVEPTHQVPSYIIGGTGVVTGTFAGTGLYEVSEVTTKPVMKVESVPKSVIKLRQLPQAKVKTALKLRQIPQQKTIAKSLSRLTQRPKAIAKSVSKSITLQKIVQKQATKLKLIQKTVTQKITKTTTKPGKGFIGFPPILPKGPTKKRRPSLKKIAQGYIAEVKRRGKWKPVSEKILPKAKAIKLGAKEARATLAATFRVVPKGITEEIDIKFKPSPEVFRAYQIRRGKKIMLKDTFIQRRGKRLAARTEVSEIIKAKKTKGRKKLRWL